MGIEIAKILSEAEIIECINLTKQAVGYMASIGFMLDSITQDYLDYWVNISNNLNDNNILFLYKINNKGLDNQSTFKGVLTYCHDS